MGQTNAIFKNVNIFRNMILMGSRSKTPEKRARFVQYMSSIVLHYLVAEAFWTHREVLKQELMNKQQDPAMLFPYLGAAPVCCDHLKSEFFDSFALEYFTQGLFVSACTFSAITSSHRNIDDSYEQLQVAVAKLSSKVDQLGEHINVSYGRMGAILNPCKYSNLPFLFPAGTLPGSYGQVAVPRY